MKAIEELVGYLRSAGALSCDQVALLTKPRIHPTR